MVPTRRRSGLNSRELGTIRQLPIFNQLKEDTLAQFGLHGQIFRIGFNQDVFTEGNEPAGVYFVLEGLIALSANSSDGRPHAIELFRTGDMFGDVGFIWGNSYGARAYATQNTRLFHIPTSAFLNAIKEDGEFAVRIVAESSKRISGLLNRIKCNATQSPTFRVIAYLLSLPPENTGDTETVVIPAAKQLVASMLHISPEAFSRALKTLLEEDLITVEKRNIQIRSRQQLISMLTV